jgi:hypothetical protein
MSRGGDGGVGGLLFIIGRSWTGLDWTALMQWDCFLELSISIPTLSLPAFHIAERKNRNSLGVRFLCDLHLNI